MYSKEAITKTKKEFWTVFGQYMKPVPSATGSRVNWPNYKTGVRHIYFRMEAARGYASIGIEISHPDVELQELFFEQFGQFEKMLHAILEEEWQWALHQEDDYGKVSSRIFCRLDHVNVMDKEDWPAIISFLKPRIIALDDFWSNVKPAFETFG